MKVFVAGAGGMLGHKVFQTLASRFPDTTGSIRDNRSNAAYRSVALLRSEQVVEGIDALDLPSLTAHVRSLRPDVVVNSIGVGKHRSAAKLAVASVTINSLLPHVLSEACREWG